MAWTSRYISDWRLSNALDASFCIEVLDETIARHDAPEIFNSDHSRLYAKLPSLRRLGHSSAERLTNLNTGRCPWQWRALMVQRWATSVAGQLAVGRGQKVLDPAALPCAPCLSSYMLVMLCVDAGRERSSAHHPPRPAR